MENRIDQLFARKSSEILNIYFTAGYPALEDTATLLKALDKQVDLIELGMPYSDPLADGPTIQASSSKALANGMHLDLLFEQIASVQQTISTPIIMMGYLNQLLQYGIEDFLKKAAEVGVSGMIIPDLPMDIYEQDYKALFAMYNLKMSFLVTPQTSEARIHKAAALSDSFLYVVAQSSITGKDGSVNTDQNAYFKKIQAMNLPCHSLIGFGIHDQATFQNACQFANGAIIGSAFIKAIGKESELGLEEKVDKFISGVLG